MEKKPLNPFELRGPNGDLFRCEVESTTQESVIRLVNLTTSDKWSCVVNSSNIDLFRSKQTKDVLRLFGLRQVVIAILEEKLRGRLGPLTSSYVPTQDWCKLLLKQKHSTYFMKLKLECQIGGKRGSWTFPMNPEDPGAIQKRESRAANGHAAVMISNTIEG
ncbi:hypothetical protein PF005_g27053 [Phytophthora fragariae]|uniref:Uncharacterized protein n=1 Tax=Phytophthora fragariae TaxID=53985 RepID=A0A6A3VSX8_9STRA|nr:hypothetical protein PF003_g35582 [Phytophthora fragariae]KAE8922555.1 hypothetical protein PF009_g27186 [Phytophthora fragariae]KAE8971091.1 hypothetical protein PF011_g26166 [Phytophthora fragariae]KAE9070146.1 hypothetical protein PF007_g27046 [Phytophthora fragariae]KAE9071089.1 hypothetical protein PF010_g26012 [Phytophthora fragariae]